MKRCTACNQSVKPVRSKFSWPIFLLGLITFGVGSIIYLLYWLLKPVNKCPMCGCKVSR